MWKWEGRELPQSWKVIHDMGLFKSVAMYRARSIVSESRAMAKVSNFLLSKRAV